MRVDTQITRIWAYHRQRHHSDSAAPNGGDARPHGHACFQSGGRVAADAQLAGISRGLSG
jgi:hypothetical protein